MRGRDIRRDYVGVVHWCGFTAGSLLAGAALGGLPHLHWLFGAGVILACEMLVALVIRWGFRRRVPGGATPITDAPSVLHLAESNAGEIRQLKARVGGILLLMHELTAAEGLPGRPAEARQVPRSAVILQFPVEAAKDRGGSRAG